MCGWSHRRLDNDCEVKMRLLMISHGYPPTVSGVTVVVRKIARAMVERGHHVTVVAASDRGEPYIEDDEGIQVIRVQSRLNPFWSDGALPVVTQSDLRQVVAEARPDVMHSHESALLSLQLLRLDADHRIPLMASCHYLPSFVAQYVGGEGRLDDFTETIVWEYAVRLLNQFDHAVFPTKTQQDMFVDHGLDVPMSVISNGVDVARYRPDGQHDPDVAQRYDLPQGPRLLFVSRLAKDKSIDVLIRAMVPLSSIGAHLILVGRGDDQARLEHLASELGLADRVHFAGFLPEEDLPAVYRACDLFAIASTCEVQSIPTLQAAASGLPIVAADAAALPELVQHAVNGFLVPPDDPDAFANATRKILEDANLVRQMGARSVEIGNTHTEELSFDAHEGLYRDLIDGGPDEAVIHRRRGLLGFGRPTTHRTRRPESQRGQ